MVATKQLENETLLSFSGVDDHVKSLAILSDDNTHETKMTADMADTSTLPVTGLLVDIYSNNAIESLIQHLKYQNTYYINNNKERDTRLSRTSQEHDIKNVLTELADLSDDNVQNRIDVVQAGGIVIVMQVLLLSWNTTDIYKQGRRILYNVICFDGNIPAVVSAKSDHSECNSNNANTQRGIERRNFLSMSTCKKVGDGYGSMIASVLNSMICYPGYAVVQEIGCYLLGHMSTNNKVRRIIDAGGIDVVTKSMKLHAYDVKIQRFGCFALSYLLYKWPKAFRVSLGTINGGIRVPTQILFSMNSIPIVVDAMSNHQNSAWVQGYGCTILSELSWVKCNAIRMAGLGVVPLLVNTMKNHDNNKKLLTSACGVIWGMCHHRIGSAQSIIRKTGGVLAIIDYMKNYNEDSGVQVNGCGALSVLCTDRRNKLQISDAGGAFVIINAMKVHESDARVQKFGCRALFLLSYNSNENKTKIGIFGGIRIVVSAMKNHDSDGDVQRDGRSVLLSLSSNRQYEKIIVGLMGSKCLPETTIMKRFEITQLRGRRLNGKVPAMI